ncbi:YhgE/Pip domain-containing protein [Macrococcus lamae]|uniref:YhgE/Pip domain-containing protein n=1 Tax=Macrococcus lamae TaxID=198484 RepID=UPI001409CB4A|nr:YhgE/Pip family protein [Macrococcus lamae]
MFKDLKYIVSKKFLLIALSVLLFLPIIYSAVFIYSMWDPYGQTRDLPIAVVNEDNGAKIQGNNENLGEQVVNKLKKNDNFKWTFVDRESASRGITEGKYFAVIRLPEDFSEHAGTMLEDNPEQVTILVKKNPGYSYSGQSIGDKSAQAVKENVSLAIRELYLKKIFKSVNDMEQNSEKLSRNLKNMQESERQLADGNNEVTNGLETLQAVLPSPQNQSVIQLTEGSKRITSGLTSLASGTDQMTAQLDNSVKQLETRSFQKINAETISDPVKLTENDVTQVENYGQSFAPYVLSLSLYVGAIAFVSIYPVDKRIGIRERAHSWWASKSLLIAGYGLLQGLLLALFTIFVMKIEIDNTMHFTLTLILWSLTAMFIVCFLTAAFSNIGKFLAIIILILQLGSSEGTFPIQLTSPFFQTLHVFSPMTYVIKALRESIFGFEGNVPFTTSITIIASIGLLMLGLLYISYIVKNRIPWLYKASEIK